MLTYKQFKKIAVSHVKAYDFLKLKQAVTKSNYLGNV